MKQPKSEQRTVYDTRDPDKELGRVTLEGLEVSEVKWASGTSSYATNKYLRTVRNPKP